LQAELSKIFRVHSYEIDFDRKLQPLSLLNYLQDTAGDHAALLGFSIFDLIERNLTWILSRYHLKITRYPAFGEKVSVITWPAGKNKLLFLREFEARDKEEGRCALASSGWILFDLKKRRPVRPEKILRSFPVNNRRAITDDFRPLPKVNKANLRSLFRVRADDLDLNRHVNHARYMEWALETVPEELRGDYQPLEIESQFREAARYGDSIICRTRIAAGEPSPTFIHQILRKKDGKELTRLRTRWEQFP